MKQHSQDSIEYQPSDWISSGVLHHLLNEPHSTTQLRTELGVDDTDPIRYRVREHMEPEGIVEVSRGESPDNNDTQIPPLMIKLTEKGREWAETLDLEYDGSRETVSSRLDYLESQVQKQADQITRLEAENERLREVMGIGLDEQVLPDVLALRAGYAGVAGVMNDEVLSDTTVWEMVPKQAADEYRELRRDE